VKCVDVRTVRRWVYMLCIVSKMKQRFTFFAVEEVKSAVRKWFQKGKTKFFKDVFQKLVQRWRKCIEVRGDFIEK